jgi:hypothetical protein
MKKIFFITSIALGLIGLMLTGCTHSSGESKAVEKEVRTIYQCPMDCESGKTYDKPGKCPVCEMELETKV